MTVVSCESAAYLAMFDSQTTAPVIRQFHLLDYPRNWVSFDRLGLSLGSLKVSRVHALRSPAKRLKWLLDSGLIVEI